MVAKRIAFDREAREAVRCGVRQLARAVKVTLGPRGRAVLLEKKLVRPQGVPAEDQVPGYGGSDLRIHAGP